MRPMPGTRRFYRDSPPSAGCLGSRDPPHDLAPGHRCPHVSYIVLVKRLRSFGRTDGTAAAIGPAQPGEPTMRPNLKLTAFATLTAFAFVAGCSAGPEAHMTGPSGPNEPPGTPQGPGEPITPTPAPTAKYAGVYSAVAPIDLTQNGVLPGVLGPALGALIELHDHPGKAI